MQTDDISPVRGLTPREAARLLRVSPARIRAWIVSGELGAVNVSRVRCGKPRYVILAHHLVAFEQGRAAAQSRPAKRRRRQLAGQIDYFPDGPGTATL